MFGWEVRSEKKGDGDINKQRGGERLGRKSALGIIGGSNRITPLYYISLYLSPLLLAPPDSYA